MKVLVVNISKPPAKFDRLHYSKPPGNQVSLENTHESVKCIMVGKGT
jgi:hypothetical protein